MSGPSQDGAPAWAYELMVLDGRRVNGLSGDAPMESIHIGKRFQLQLQIDIHGKIPIVGFHLARVACLLGRVRRRVEFRFHWKK
jgi:hypothetical protein